MRRFRETVGAGLDKAFLKRCASTVAPAGK